MSVNPPVLTGRFKILFCRTKTKGKLCLAAAGLSAPRQFFAAVKIRLPVNTSQAGGFETLAELLARIEYRRAFSEAKQESQ